MMKQEQVAQVTLGDLLPAALTIVTLIIASAIGAKVIQDLGSSLTNTPGFNASNPHNGTLAWNATVEGQAGLINLSEQIPLIGTVIALSAVLFIVIRLVR